MTGINDQELEMLATACDTIRELPKIRFVGIINKMGKLVVGKFREGVESYLDNKEDGMAYMEIAMEVFLREEFDEKLGAIDYVHSKRKKISMISIPIGKYLVLVSAEPDLNVDTVVSLAHKVFPR